MTSHDHFRVLDLILSEQKEGRADGVLSEERIRQSLTDGPPLDATEQRILWLSPDTRSLYMGIRQEVREAVSLRMRSAGFGGRLPMRMAASGGTEERIEGPGYVLDIFWDDIPGAEWSISLRLNEDYVRRLPANTRVVLRDEGGQVWLSGIPDEQRMIEAVWPAKSEKPAERLTKFALWLEP